MRALSDSTVDILLVDDREDGLVTLEALLRDQGNYNLVRAQSGQEALRKVGLYDFAMVLLDVQMPILDGFQTAELMHRRPGCGSLPIIFVTAINKDERYVYRGFEVGAVDYIFKPFDPMMLRSKVAVFADLHLKNRKISLQAMQLAEREHLAHRAQMQAIELENLRRYRNLADAIPHIVLRMAGPDLLDYHNALWTHYTAQRPEDGQGSGWLNAIDARDRQGLLKLWRESIFLRKPFEIEVRIRRYDGIFRWHWFKAEPELNSAGEVITWLATCTDIHARKVADQELMVAHRTAEAANEAKTHFLANMSHEIRTPLTAIMGFSDLLSDPTATDREKSHSAAVIRRNGYQLLKIVDEILDISKVEAGGLDIELVEIELDELLGEIGTVMKAQAEQKGLELIFEIAESVPPRVTTDPTRLRQILLNVIGNAIKFTQRGSVRTSADFRIRDGSQFLHFEVTDTGLGIDPSAADKIFEPFSQADSSTTRLYGGTGLGLPLSRRLAQALGGNVQLLESQPGGGSRFEIVIRADAPAEGEGKAPRGGNGENTPIAGIAELSGRRVLLVEDAEDNRTLITSYLSTAGVKMDVAENGLEGVEKALAGDYELVLMDIQMPVMDGYQATEKLRKAGYKKPIIALTAHAMASERERSLRQGCTEHITKPVNRRKLIEGLLRVMRGALDGKVLQGT